MHCCSRIIWFMTVTGQLCGIFTLAVAFLTRDADKFSCAHSTAGCLIVVGRARETSWHLRVIAERSINHSHADGLGAWEAYCATHSGPRHKLEAGRPIARLRTHGSVVLFVIVDLRAGQRRKQPEARNLLAEIGVAARYDSAVPRAEAASGAGRVDRSIRRVGTVVASNRRTFYAALHSRDTAPLALIARYRRRRLRRAV